MVQLVDMTAIAPYQQVAGDPIRKAWVHGSKKEIADDHTEQGNPLLPT